MASTVSAHDSTFDASSARPLFDAHPRVVRWSYAVSLDGQRFLVNTLVEATTQTSLPYSVSLENSAPLTLVVNWQHGLK